MYRLEAATIEIHEQYCGLSIEKPKIARRSQLWAEAENGGGLVVTCAAWYQPRFTWQLVSCLASSLLCPFHIYFAFQPLPVFNAALETYKRKANGRLRKI